MTVETAATKAVAASGVAYRLVEYGPVASLAEAARKRGVAVSRVLKSLVVRVGEDDYLVVLVPGDRVIDWPKLRALVGVSRMSLAPEEEAFEATGFPRGAITPFGMARALPVVCDVAVEPGEVSVGGGAHGVSIHLDREDLIRVTGATVSDVTKAAA